MRESKAKIRWDNCTRGSSLDNVQVSNNNWGRELDNYKKIITARSMHWLRRETEIATWKKKTKSSWMLWMTSFPWYNREMTLKEKKCSQIARIYWTHNWRDKMKLWETKSRGFKMICYRIRDLIMILREKLTIWAGD